MPEVNAEILALGFLGESVRATNEITDFTAGMRNPTISDLVAAGVYVHSANDGDTLSPRLSGLLVRHALRDNSETFGLSAQITFTDKLLKFNIAATSTATSSIWEFEFILKQLLSIDCEFGLCDVVDSASASSSQQVGHNSPQSSHKEECGGAFEQFHCFVEVMKQHVRVICWPNMNRLDRIVCGGGEFVRSSLVEHYFLGEDSEDLQSGPRWLVSDSQSKNAFVADTEIETLCTFISWPLFFMSSQLPTHKLYVEIDGPTEPFDALLSDARRAVEQLTNTSGAPNDTEDWTMRFIRSIGKGTNALPGYDASMLVRAKPEGRAEEIWCILLEFEHSLKKQPAVDAASGHSADAAGAQSSEQSKIPYLGVNQINWKLKTIRENNYVEQLLNVGVKRVIYVMPVWRGLANNLRKHTLSGLVEFKPEQLKCMTVLLLGRAQLQEFYSPSLVPYASYFAYPR